MRNETYLTRNIELRLLMNQLHRKKRHYKPLISDKCGKINHLHREIRKIQTKYIDLKRKINQLCRLRLRNKPNMSIYDS